MSIFVLQLTNTPQTFQVSMAGKNYIMTSKFNSAEEGGWLIDLVDAITNLPIVANIPMVTGANLLSGLEYLGFGGKMIVFTDGNDEAVPTYENLGIESNLYFQPDDENA